MACWFRSLFIPDPYWQRPSAARSARQPRPDPARLGSPVVQARLAAGFCENASFQDDALRERRKARYSRSSRSEEHTSELQSLMRISYAVFCLKKKKKIHNRKIVL